MTDDLVTRLGRALDRQVEQTTTGPAPRPTAAAVVATAHRRVRRRRFAAGAAAAVALIGVAMGRPWQAEQRQDIQVSTAGPSADPAAAPRATTTMPSTTTSVTATTDEATATFGSPTAITTPTYQPLAWYDLVDGVQVAWQTDGEVTTTWTRVDAGAPQAVGIERPDARAHVVPTGPRSLVIVVFAGPGAEPPEQVTVDADGIAPSWTDVTWDPVASVGWARPRWTTSEPPTDDLAVAQR